MIGQPGIIKTSHQLKIMKADNKPIGLEEVRALDGEWVEEVVE
jgi:hypothetical protein